MKEKNEPEIAVPSSTIIAVRDIESAFQSGDIDKARELAIALLKIMPSEVVPWKILGAIWAQSGELEKAARALSEALKITPLDYATYNNLGIVLKRQGRMDEASRCFRQAIEHNQSAAEPLNNLGLLLSEAGNLHAAELYLRKAISLKPNYSDGVTNLANTLAELGHHKSAYEEYQAALKLNPDYAKAHTGLGNLHYKNGQYAAAEKSYRKSIEVNPHDAEAHCNFGTLLRARGHFTAAERQYRTAINLKADFVEAHYNLTQIISAKNWTADHDSLEKLYRDSKLNDHQRCFVCFSLAKTFSDLGEQERAMEYYREANTIRKSELNYDYEKDKRLFAKIKEKQEKLAELTIEKKHNDEEFQPIFILGMPRSGTTLVEQIVSSHTKIFGAGELPFMPKLANPLFLKNSEITTDDVYQVRRQYSDLVKGITTKQPVFTDKLPHNFLFLGLISAAIPEAKIIHVYRDPAAVCWSNYTTRFTSRNIGYCYDLEDLKNYYRAYEDLMLFWKSEYNLGFYNLSYETLTDQQEAETSKVLAYLNLAWEENCLFPESNMNSVRTAAAIQVRKKVYKGSSEQWKKFRPFLGGLLDDICAKQ